MKLSTRTNFFFISGIGLVFLIGGFVFFHILKKEINHEIVEQLYADQKKIESEISKYDTLPKIFLSVGDLLKIEKTSPSDFSSKAIITDTILYNEYEKQELPYRQISFYCQSKSFTYQITLSKSLIESKDLIEGITKGLVILFILFIIALLLLNQFISRRLWSPFYQTLNKIKTFDLSSQDILTLPNTSIKEFKQLNSSLKTMTDRIQQDYISLKEFTENASHEIQTPLSIIKLKLENIIQADNLTEELLQNIKPIYESANRLSKLNQSLLLITKIENNQFANKESINFSEVLLMQIENFEELIKAKNIKLEVKASQEVYLSLNLHLIEILVSNLLTNAIKHNVENGEIKIELVSNKIIVSNTGLPLSHDSQQLFKRFKKNDDSSASLGLGLAIVKKICEMNQLDVTYQFIAPYHSLTIVF